MKASALSQTNDKDSLLVMSNLDDLILNTLYPSTLAKKRAKSQFKRQREKREYLEYVDEIRPGLCSKIDDVERWLDSVPEIHEDRSNEWVGSHKHECREVLIHLSSKAGAKLFRRLGCLAIVTGLAHFRMPEGEMNFLEREGLGIMPVLQPAKKEILSEFFKDIRKSKLNDKDTDDVVTVESVLRITIYREVAIMLMKTPLSGQYK